MPRGFKKFLYGLLYAAIAVFVVWWWYAAHFAPAPSCSDGVENQGETGIDCGGPCTPCAFKQLSPLQAGDAELFKTDGGDVAVVGVLTNPNASYDGTASYTVSVAGERGDEVASALATVRVPAGGVWYTYDTFREGNESMTAASVRIQDTVWGAANAPAVGGSAVSASSSLIDIEDGRVVVHGTVTNQGLASAQHIDIIAVISDANGFPLFASKTFIEALGGGNSENFTILFPQNKTLAEKTDTRNVTLYVDVP